MYFIKNDKKISRLKKKWGIILLLGVILLIPGCHKSPIERGPVFTAVEMTLSQPGPVKDDLIARGLVKLSQDGFVGEIKIGEIEKLVKDNIYRIDENGYLQFGPSYIPIPTITVQ